MIKVWHDIAWNDYVYWQIMGHSDIGVKLNTYTHVGFEDAQKELSKVYNKMA